MPNADLESIVAVVRVRPVANIVEHPGNIDADRSHRSSFGDNLKTVLVEIK